MGWTVCNTTAEHQKSTRSLSHSFCVSRARTSGTNSRASHSRGGRSLGWRYHISPTLLDCRWSLRVTGLRYLGILDYEPCDALQQTD